MLITFFGSHAYDKESFNAIRGEYPELELEYWDTELTPKTASYVKEGSAVCAFVNADEGADTIRALKDRGFRDILPEQLLNWQSPWQPQLTASCTKLTYVFVKTTTV